MRNDKKEFSWRESAIIFSDKRSNGRSADFFIAEATVIGLDNEADYYKEHVLNSHLFHFPKCSIFPNVLFHPFEHKIMVRTFFVDSSNQYGVVRL